MTGTDLVKMYEFSYGTISRNLEGVSHQDSLVLPQPSGNCLNWVLGHIVVTRNTILSLAGKEPALSGDQVQIYKRGSTPSEGTQFMDLATLRGLLDDSQHRLVPALAVLSEQALAGDVPEPLKQVSPGSIADALARLNCHEGYHSGQIALLRRVAGKAGAIR
jgi:uncharacterized damage-inducible protein DinB